MAVSLEEEGKDRERWGFQGDPKRLICSERFLVLEINVVEYCLWVQGDSKIRSHWITVSCCFPATLYPWTSSFLSIPSTHSCSQPISRSIEHIILSFLCLHWWKKQGSLSFPYLSNLTAADGAHVAIRGKVTGTSFRGRGIGVTGAKPGCTATGKSWSAEFTFLEASVKEKVSAGDWDLKNA